MTFEELQDLLAEQFSCDTGDLSRGTALADLGADRPGLGASSPGPFPLLQPDSMNYARNKAPAAPKR